jgi:hypothetical protein
MTPSALMACAAACLLATAPAHADADADNDSRLGDETEVVEAGDCEVELTLERVRKRGSIVESGRAVELACGIGWGSELALAYGRQSAGGERDEELVFEVKTELVEADAGRPGWTFGVLVAGAHAPGMRWRRSEWGAVVETTLLPADRWVAELQLGVARDLQQRRWSTLWSAALEHALDERFELRAEVGGDDRSRPLVEFGLRWLFAEDAHLTTSFGARSGAERERVVGVALKVEF